MTKRCVYMYVKRVKGMHCNVCIVVWGNKSKNAQVYHTLTHLQTHTLWQSHTHSECTNTGECQATYLIYIEYLHTCTPIVI